MDIFLPNFHHDTIYFIAADTVMAVQYDDGRVGPMRSELLLLQLPDSMGNG
jgi:hypothetical protein